MRWVVAVKTGADEDALRRIVMERCGQLVRTATISFGLWCQDFDLCGQACEVWHRATLMRNRIAEFAAVTGRTPIGLVLDGCVYELTPDGSAKRHLFIELGVGRYVLTGMDAIISVEDQSISATERQRRASEGARVEVVELPDPGVLYALTNLINKAEAATIHGTWVRTRRDDYSLSAVNRFEAGFHIPATQYLDAMRLRGRLLADFARRVFERVDLVHMPVLGIPVPTIEETEIRSTAAVPQLMERITRYTRWVNYLGLPALSVPCGYSANGLPVAFQLLGRPFSEARLLRVAHVYQQATKHHERRPPE